MIHGEHMDDEDMSAMDHGKMLKGQAEIPRVNIELSFDDFPGLKEESVGDEIVLTVKGKIDSVGDDGLSAGFTVASVVHGKMHEMHKGMKPGMLEDVLSEKGPSKKMSMTGRKH